MGTETDRQVLQTGQTHNLLMMRPFKFSGCAIFLLGTYILSFLMGDLVHHHVPVHGQMDRPALASHSCGDHERHIPLDLVRSCAVCLQSLQRVANLSSSPYLLPLLVRTVELPLPAVAEIPLFHRSSQESRGPPVA